MNARELPRFISDMMASPPRTGEGVHNYLFRLARVLHPYRTEEEIFSILESLASTCGRCVSAKEIRDAIRNSKQYAWTPDANIPPGPTAPRWPKPNQEQIEAIVQEGFRLADLWGFSPFHLDDDLSHAEEIIDVLFPGNPLLCVGLTNSNFHTRPREDWRAKLASFQFIVPSPMTSVKGRTKEGKLSEHCLDNTGPRRFLVLEFDQGSLDQQAGILRHLALKEAPLVIALLSGGKSLHGWFYTQGRTEDALQKFMRLAVGLGADPATWTRSQFVRMPDGLRDNGRRQTVLYFNPSTLRHKYE